MLLRKAPLLNLAGVVYGTREPKPPRLRQLLALQWLVRTSGGVAVTPEGREALRQGVVEAEALAAQGLGDHNAALERGRSDVAEKHLASSQRYLDLANDLRGTETS